MAELSELWASTADVRAVLYEKECPNGCGELLVAKRYPKPEEIHGMEVSKTYDKLTEVVANHLAYDCGGD